MGLRSIYISTVIIVIAFLTDSVAQVVHPQEFPYTFTIQNTKHGLPQNQILHIMEGEKGILASTMTGIVYYNGVEFTVLPIHKKNQNYVYSELVYDKKTKVLYGQTYDKKYNQIYPRFEKLLPHSCIYVEENFITGITAEGVIQKCSYDKKTIYETHKTSIRNPICILSHQNSYYVYDNTHLYRIDKKTGKEEVILKGECNVLKTNPYTNQVYVICSDLYCIDGEKIHKIALQSHPREGFRDIAFLSEKEFMITSSMGLYHIVDGKVNLYNQLNEPAFNSLYGIYHYQPENCIFIGTENSGLITLTSKNTKTYYTDSKVTGSQSFSSVIKDKSGAIYSTASVGDIIRIKDQQKETYLRINKHVATLSFIDDLLYAGTWEGGILIYKDKKLVDSIKTPILPSLNVQSIFKDSENNIWIGTHKGLVKQDASGKYELLSSIRSRIVTAYELKNGTLCFGGTDGVLILNKKGQIICHLNYKDGLKCREVRTFYEDKKGRLWIGTYQGGLYVYEKNRLTSINDKPNCGLNKDVFTMAHSDDGTIYISSNEGIWSVIEKKLVDFYEGKIDYLIPAYFGQDVGIVNTEFNGGFQNNYGKSGDYFYFPSIYGLTEFKPHRHLKKSKLEPVLKSVIINDTIFPPSSVFERTTHTIQFDFYCTAFIEQYNVHYQYKLIGEGLPNTWSKLQKSPTVSLKMLPPGEYTFYIRGIDASNEANPNVISYTFQILPYFYETTLFKVILVVIMLFMIFFGVRYRIRKENEKNKINNSFLELKLNAIQSKMNPHFMFNSLNNIIYLLTIEKYSEAEQLLEEFSQLLRRFIEKSDSSFISIKEEMEMIRLYLSIQQKRYNNQFEYIIQTEDDLANKIIPSMLIQPFVENSIIHGFAHSNVKGQLVIEVKNKKNQYITIRIEDNGIGRIKSKEINQHRHNHVSKGITLIHEKIKIMEQKYAMKIRLTITDIEEDNKTGTLIILKIPINDKLFDS